MPFPFKTLLFLILAVASQAATAQSSSDKLDLNEIEEKYWAGKDTDFKVVQNRAFEKAHRLFLNVGYGPLVNDPYSYGRMLNFSGGYFWNEMMGVEISNETGYLSDNDSTVAFRTQNAFPPNYNRFTGYQSINFIWTPIYAKMSLFDVKILHFDLALIAGLGNMTYESQIDPSQGGSKKASSLGYNFDISQQIFFHKNIAVRFDIRNKWSKQDKYRFRIGVNEAESNRSLGSSTVQDTSMLLGLNFYF